MAVRRSVVAGAAVSATAYALSSLQGRIFGQPSLTIAFEMRSGVRGGGEEGDVATTVEVDAQGNRRITRTKTVTEDGGSQRVQRESLRNPQGSERQSILNLLPFQLPDFVKRMVVEQPGSAGFGASSMARLIGGTAAAALWGAACTWPAARAEWRYALFGQRSAMMAAQPGAYGMATGVRVLLLSWLSGVAVAGTVFSGGIALVGIPAAILTGLPALALGSVAMPLWHRQIALRLVRDCLL